MDLVQVSRAPPSKLLYVVGRNSTFVFLFAYLGKCFSLPRRTVTMPRRLSYICLSPLPETNILRCGISVVACHTQVTAVQFNV